MPQLSFKIQADYEKVIRLREEISKLKQELNGVNAIQNPTAFNALNAKLQQTSQELGNVTSKIAQTSATMETDFKQKIFVASQSVNGFTAEIIKQKKIIADTKEDIRSLSEQYRSMGKFEQSTSPVSAKLKEAKNALAEQQYALFQLTQEQATARLSVKKLRDEYALFKEEGGGTANTLDLLNNKMKGIAATVLGGMGLKELGSRIISVRAEFESMETSLKVLLGGNQERLDSIMKQIKEYALASPLNTKDMVGAVQMMTSFGIEAEKSIDYLKAIGDISMGNTGKFNSLALAFSQMSSAGKLMGQDLLQMVNAGFNPLEEISRKTGKSIGQLKEEMSKGAISSKMVQEAFISVTSAGGKFYGMSSEGAKTLNGQISMLQESFDNMFNEIGQKGEGVVMGAVKLGTSLVENYEKVGKILAGLVITYGVYKAALITNIALTHSFAVAARVDATARGIQTAATKAQTIAQMALNSVMKANPYVLLATAIVGVGAAMWALHDSTTAQERAQKRVNEENEKFKESLDERSQKINSLLKILKDEAATEFQKAEAYSQLGKIVPELTEKYNQQELALIDLGKAQKTVNETNDQANYEFVESQIDAYIEKVKSLKDLIQDDAKYNGGKQGSVLASQLDDAQAALDNYYKQLVDIQDLRKKTIEDARPIEVRIREAQGNEQVRQNIYSFFKDAMSLAEEMQAGNDNVNFLTMEVRLDAFIEKAQKDLQGLREREKKNPLDMSLRLEEAEKQRALDGLLGMKESWKRTGKTFIPLQFQVDWNSAKRALLQAKDALTGLNITKVSDNFATNFNKAKKTYIDAKKALDNINKNKSKHTTKEYTDAKANFEAAEKEYKNLGGDTSTTKKSRSAENKKEILRKEKERYWLMAAEQKLARERAIRDLELDTRQLEIDMMEDGSNKTLKQLQLNFDRENEKIKRGYEDLKKSKIENARKLWEANPNNKGKSFNEKTVNTEYTEEEIKKHKIQLSSNQNEYNKGVKEVGNSNERALNEYLKEYGTYEEKRLAISKLYAEKIQNAKNEGEKKSLKKQKQGEYNDLDLKELKKNINWEFVFGNLDSIDIGTASVVKDQLEQFIEMSKNLEPDQIKAVVDAISQLQEKMDLSHPIESIKKARTEYATAKTEYDKYKNALASAKESGDKAGEKKAANMMLKSSQKMIKAKNKEKKAFKSVTSVIDEYASALKDAGEAIGGAAGECISLAASALSAGVSMAQGIQAFGEAASNMERAVAILAIIQAALKAIQVIMKIFGDSEDSSLATYVETMDTYIKLLDDSIKGVNDRIKDTKNSIKDTTEYYQQLITLQTESAKAIKSQSQTWLNSGASKGFLGIGSKSSEGVKIVEQMKGILSSGNDEVRKFAENGFNSLNQYFRKVTGRLANSASDFGRLDWIWKMSDEDLAKLSKDVGAMTLLGDKLSSAVKEYVEKTNAVTDALNSKFEAILDVSFDSFYDEFKSMISEMDNDSETFSNNFAEYMRNALIKNLIASKYKEDLERLYKKAGEYTQNKVLNKHIAELKAEYQKIASNARNEVNNIDSITGYGEQEAQKATINEAQELTEDTGRQLVGRLTAMQISVEQGNIKRDMTNAQLSLMTSTMEDLKLVQVQTRDIANETRDILSNSYLELKEISRNTEETASHLKEVKSDIRDLKRIIKDNQ